MDSDAALRENPTSAKTGQMWGTTITGTKRIVRCGPPACGDSILSNLFREIEFAYTLVKKTPGAGPTRCETDALGDEFCDYPGFPWCTPATSPPDYAPAGVRRAPVIPVVMSEPYYWFTFGACTRPGPPWPWDCIGFIVVGFASPDTYPKFACTRNP